MLLQYFFLTPCHYVYSMQQSGKSLPKRGSIHSAWPSATRAREIPPPECRMRFLTKSALGASRLAAFSAHWQEAGAGRRVRRAANTGGCAHLPAGKEHRKILQVALQQPWPLREEPFFLVLCLIFMSYIHGPGVQISREYIYTAGCPGQPRSKIGHLTSLPEFFRLDDI